MSRGSVVKSAKVRKSLYGLKESPRAWFGRSSNDQVWVTKKLI